MEKIEFLAKKNDYRQWLKYDHGMKSIFPPRPKGRMNPSDLPMYERTGQWLAQRKFNGCRNLIHILPSGKIECFAREGGPHDLFEFTETYSQEILKFLRIQPNTEYWLDSEVMSKTKNAAKEIVFYDVLHAGKYLFNSLNQMQRLDLLNEICGNPQEKIDKLAYRISDHLWMAETFQDQFKERFQESLPNPQLEGLVLRKKKSVLDHYGNSYYEVGWMIRCRKPDGKYNF